MLKLKSPALQIILSFLFYFMMVQCTKEVEKPIIDTIEPTKGLIGDPVTIKGSHLSNASSVSFNGKTSLVLNNTPNELSTVVPLGAAIGGNTVVVQTGSGTSNGLQFEAVPEPEFIDASPPEIEKTIPSSTFINYPVLIYGNFLSGIISLTFDGVEAEIFTNNQRVVTTIVPGGISTGQVMVKIRTVQGTSEIRMNIQGPPPNGVIPPNFSIMNIPPPNYIPLISNQWSCGLFSEEDGNTFVDLDSGDGINFFSTSGRYEYNFDKNRNYNNLNYVEIVNTETGEILAGQFSSSSENPCIYRMILISSETGLVQECTVDVTGFGDPCEN